jgi:AAA domain
LHRESPIRCRGTGATFDDVRLARARWPGVVVADRDGVRQARVTTAQAIDDERAILELAERGRRAAPAVITSDLDERGLGEDQARVVRRVLETPNAVLAVDGKAGTGKSHTLAAVRELAVAACWTVRGFAPTTTAVGVLREVALDSRAGRVGTG